MEEDFLSIFTMASVVECAFAHAERKPDALCLADGKTRYSYADVRNLVKSRGACLVNLGCAKGDYALVECNQTADFIVWMLACHLVGVIAVPLEKNASETRKSEIMEETGAIVHIGPTSCEELASLQFCNITDPCDNCVSQLDDAAMFPAAEDVAEVLFSTGTTGKSKGIVITHRNNMAIAENIINGLQMKPENVEVIPMPLSHSHGLRRTYSNIVNGSSAVIADGVLALKRLFQLMDDYAATSMDLSPSMLSIIFKLSKDRLGNYADQLDYVQLGSAPLAEDDKDRIRSLLPRTRLYNFYGSTEAGCSCLLEFGMSANKEGCIGKPCVNAEFIVVDEQRNPIQSSPDRLGLLASAGDINMRCYFNAPELTAETMQNGYIFTKDLGYIDEEGYVFMLGRKDDVINFGGVKIAPEEVEAEVLKHPAVRDCACVPITDELTGQKPVLCIALEEGASYDFKEFKAFLAKALDANKQPALVEVIDEIPRTFNGKIIRKELVARFDR